MLGCVSRSLGGCRVLHGVALAVALCCSSTPGCVLPWVASGGSASVASSAVSFSQSFVPTLTFARADVAAGNANVDIEDVGEDDEEMPAVDGMPSADNPEDVASLLRMSPDALKERVAAMFDAMLPEGKTEVEADDVEAFYKKMTNDSQRRSIAAEFDTMDTDDDQAISFQELKAGTIDEEDETPVMKVEDLQRRFDAVDQDKSGSLNLTELAMMMDPSKNRELMDIEVKEILATQDTNNDGKVSLEEFLNTEEVRQAESAGENIDKQELTEEFNLYDLNGDGFIDVAEMEQVIGNPTIGELRAYLKSLFGETQKLTKEAWLKDYQKHAVSVLTDNAELLRMPEEYPSLKLAFENLPGLASPSPAGGEHEEL